MRCGRGSGGGAGRFGYGDTWHPTRLRLASPSGSVTCAEYFKYNWRVYG